MSWPARMIYALCDPHTQEPRYLGRTIQWSTVRRHVLAGQRHLRHPSRCRCSPLTLWVAACVRLGTPPTVRVLARLEDTSLAVGTEALRLLRARLRGVPLFNRQRRATGRQSRK